MVLLRLFEMCFIKKLNLFFSSSFQNCFSFNNHYSYNETRIEANVKIVFLEY